jgi:outer membrane protein assembly factor BamD (BamD/ComL family)
MASGCVSFHRPVSMLPAPVRQWPATLAQAQASAARGDFDQADSVLAEFATAYPGTSETLEAVYWRALFRMDPSNHAESMPAAMAALDAYLADHRPRPHVAEATTLRRLAGQIDGLNRLAAATVAEPKEGAAAPVPKTAAGDLRTETAKSADVQANEAEIRRLKDELAKANAELDRIKRRLAQPPPPQR